MLFSPVFAKLQRRPARRTALSCSSFSALTWLPQHSNLQPANISTALDSKSFPLNSFADPHLLTPVASIFYKNSGGQGVPRSAIPCRHFASISPLAATLMDLLVSVANKRLTALAKPFRCNIYKKAGGRGIVPILVRPAHSRRVNYSGEGEMGTGARGAPVPEVGFYVKIKRVQFRSRESHPNEGHVNSP